MLLVLVVEHYLYRGTFIKKILNFIYIIEKTVKNTKKFKKNKIIDKKIINWCIKGVEFSKKCAII